MQGRARGTSTESKNDVVTEDIDFVIKGAEGEGAEGTR